MVILRGNDIMLRWTITKCLDGSEVPEDFSGADLSVFIVSAYNKSPIKATVEGNVIVVLLPGNKQRNGKFGLEAVWSKNNAKNWSRAKIVNAFEITDDQQCATHCGNSHSSDVEVRVVQLNSTMSGSIGHDGLTPYIKNGNWWIGDTDTGVSAHGEKGDPFTYDDFTPEQIADLQKPAIDAIARVDAAEANRVVAENKRIDSESARVTNESSRITEEDKRLKQEGARIESEKNRTSAEQLRASAEITRSDNEGIRVSNESARVTAESNRQSKEVTRVNNEESRISSESLRNEGEKGRVSSEQIRVRQEHTRVQEESDRSTAETARINSENKRIDAESARVSAETNRVAEFDKLKQSSEQATKDATDASVLANDKANIANTAAQKANTAAESANTAKENSDSAEVLRKAAEADRVLNESTRATSEGQRVSAEADRTTSETNRNSSEAERKNQEVNRVSAESNRVAAETIRVNSESDRVSNETARIKAETSRSESESTRVTEEGERATAETSRVTKELERIKNEDARNTAETSRVNAEKNRVIAESNRGTVFDQKVALSDAATEKANAAAQNATASAQLASTKAAEAQKQTELSIIATKKSEQSTGITNELNANPPKTINGTWWIWDTVAHAYKDTKIQATGKSPYISDHNTWVIWDDVSGEYVDTNISVSSQYILTKAAIEGVFTGNITSHTHNYDEVGSADKALNDAKSYSDGKFVQLVPGKQLSTEDFTTILKTKLNGLSNFDPSGLQNQITQLDKTLETLLGTGDTSTVIDTFREIQQFLDGITSKDNLAEMLSQMQITIEAKIPTKLTQLTNDGNFVRDAAYVHTDSNYTAEEKKKLSGVAVSANNYVHPLYTNKDIGFYRFAVDNLGHVSSVSTVVKSDITNLGIPAQDTTYNIVTVTDNGLMSAIDKEKLNGIQSGAQVNPTSLPASDVYPWAKAKTKPSYGYSEIIGTPTLGSMASINDAPKDGKQYARKNNIWDEVKDCDYPQLSNKPSINGTQLTGDLTIDKTFVGLGNVDNTSDLLKPISTATQGAIDKKLDKQDGYSLISDAEKTKLSGIEAGAQVNVVHSVNTKTGKVVLVKDDIGLSNVDNTSDLDKPTSTDTQTKLDKKVDKTITVAGKPLSANVVLSKTDVGLQNVDNTSDANKPISVAQQKALDGKESVFTKNTAFNKNFGTIAGSVCEGNDSRLSDSRQASDVYPWAKALSKPTYEFSEITTAPTTLSGYGITDAPTKTGIGASGTWGISITGNSHTVDGLHINGVDNINANALVRTDENGQIKSGWIQTVSGTGDFTPTRVYCANDSYIRYLTPSDFISKLKLINSDNISSQHVSYAANAGNSNTTTKLQTARSIWGQSFDGTGNITGNIILKGGTSADMSDAGNIHPRIRFDNSDSTQTVSLIFTDHDSYRTPAGIKLVGNLGSEWFEAPLFVKTGSSDSYMLLGGGGHKLISDFVSSTDSRLTNARPASDVFAWAKQPNKPSYAWGEITGKPSTFDPSEHKQALTSSECTTYETDYNTIGVTPAAVKKAFSLFEPKSHVHTRSQISDFPTSLPASDVPSWAKAASKPAYTASEVGALGVSANAVSATKIATARKIFGRSFDGTADVIDSIIHSGTAVTTLTGLPINKDIVVATLSAATDLTLSAAMDVYQLLTIVVKPTSAITQPIPITNGWSSMDGDTLTLESGKLAEISILCYESGKYSVSFKTTI